MVTIIEVSKKLKMKTEVQVATLLGYLGWEIDATRQTVK